MINNKNRGKILIIIISVVLLAGIGGFIAYQTLKGKKATEIPTTSIENLNNDEVKNDIENMVSKKYNVLENLVKDEEIIKAIEEANLVNKSKSSAEIAELDRKWANSGSDSPFISSFLTNSTAKKLLDFQDNNPGFVELFVTDAVGLNVGQTNKTSDYYQADEEWWTKAFNNGAGKLYHGEMEYDESAKAESIAIYVPVFNSNRETIGVLKAVLSITAVRKEL